MGSLRPSLEWAVLENPGAVLGLTPRGGASGPANGGGCWDCSRGERGRGGFLLRPMGSCLWRRGGALLAGLGAAFDGLSGFTCCPSRRFLCSRVPPAARQPASPRAGLRGVSAVEAATPWPGPTVLGHSQRGPASVRAALADHILRAPRPPGVGEVQPGQCQSLSRV